MDFKSVAGTLLSILFAAHAHATPIDDKYAALGGQSGFLGASTTAELATPDGVGRYRHFAGGSIYWHPNTGAFEVHGLIREKWASLGWEKSPLGFPITDETATPDGAGRYNHFQGGSVYWSPATGAFEIHGPIRDKWSRLAWEAGLLGYPKTDVTKTPDGAGEYVHFQNGSIYWHPETGAREVHGLIRAKWADMSWERGDLGYPIADEMDTFDGAGRVSKFQGGELIWMRATNGVRVVKSTSLIIDLPFADNEVWRVVQANGVRDFDPGRDSHTNQWSYAWDFARQGAATMGAPFRSAADGQVLWVIDNFKAGDGADNRIAIRLGEGRYASYLHAVQGSYRKRNSGDGSLIFFLPQNAPGPVTAPGGRVLADTGDVCERGCGAHLHFAVTTKPDIPAFAPFETVPVSFRNFDVQEACAGAWRTVTVGRPKTGQCVRKRPNTGGTTAPVLTSSVTPLHYGVVRGAVTAGDGRPKGDGEIVVRVASPWGEPLRETRIKLGSNIAAGTNNFSGPWTFEIPNVPAYGGLTVTAVHAGPWSVPTGGGSVTGASAAFDLAPGGAATADVALATTTIR